MPGRGKRYCVVRLTEPSHLAGHPTMFFKRANKHKPNDTAQAVPANDTEPVVEVRPIETTVTDAPAEATPPAVSVELSPDIAKSTDVLEPEPGPIGQDLALAALAFGLDMPGPAYHIYVAGPAGYGKHVAVRAVLEKAAAAKTPPSDWVLVRDFSGTAGAHALELPRGRARPFASAMRGCIETLRSTLAMAFDDEDTDFRRRAIDEEFRAVRDGALEALNQKAAAQNIAVLRSSAGYVLAPMHEGRVVKAEVFEQLPEPMREQIELRVQALQRELEKILDTAVKSDLARRERHSDLNAEIGRRAVDAAFAEIRAAYADLPEVSRHIEAAATDLVRRGAELTQQQHGSRRSRNWMAARIPEPSLRAYWVAPLIAAEDGMSGLPVVAEVNPTLDTLFGLCAAEPGDHEHGRAHLAIRPGALHAAHCGALMLDAGAIADAPPVWHALKAALVAERVPIGAALTNASLAGSMPLSVKVVLIGTNEGYEALKTLDPEFERLFQIHVPFAENFDDTADNRRLLARRLADIVRRHALRSIDATGIAAILEQCAAWSNAPGRLSLDIGKLTDLAREASLWASIEGHDVVSRIDVDKALSERAARLNSTAVPATPPAPSS